MNPRSTTAVLLTTAAGAALAAAVVAVPATAGDHAQVVHQHGTLAAGDATAPAFAAELEGVDLRLHATTTPLGTTRFVLKATGLQPHRTYGAHLHTTACAVAMGSGHYQHVPGQVTGGSEAWLDLTTNAGGVASSVVDVDWAVADGVRSVVVHAQPTHPVTGAAGARLGCLTAGF